MAFTTKNKIFNRANNLNDKISKDKLTLDDMKETNDLDELTTKGMLALEGKIRKIQNHYPWSSILKKSMLEVSLWKFVISEIKNEVSKEMQIQRIVTQLEAPPILERHSIKMAVNNLRIAKKFLKQIQTDATNHREKFLQHKVDEKEIKGNMEHTRYIKMLIFIKTQKEMHSTIRKFKTRNGQNNITYIDIPKDMSMDWNEIPKTLPQEEWKRIEDSFMVEKYIIGRIRWYLNQAQGTPCTIELLQTLLALDSLTTFGNSVFDGTVDLSQLPLTKLQQLYFTEMKKTEKPLINKVHNKISLNEMKYAFTKWKERTPTSPSGRHLGHYKTLIVSDGEEINEKLKAFSYEMLSAYTPLYRWEQSLVLMIEKEKNDHRINRLRVINIYKADYNLILKYFWSHKTTQYVERNNLLGDNQWDGDFSVIPTM